ncbi:MAG TPA: PRTRC system protein B [Ramlibacter sp.]|jgi:PRTRC genetic system protein B|nr:PRTRC system protein B [Ramlibacter sp.]
MQLEVQSTGESYQLTAAVLVYTNSTTRHAFATKHAVRLDQGRPSIAPGTPLDSRDYDRLVQALAPSAQPRMVWSDPRVLAHGFGRLLWWSPPMQRSLFFRKSAHHPHSFDGCGRCSCPGLVFLADGRDLFVYAFKGTTTPTRATRLYQAPFFNVWSRGQVCCGTATVPPEHSADPDAWERMFFGSHFTHPNFTQADRLTVGVAPGVFWQARLAQPEVPFPEQVLFDLQLRLEELTHIDLRARLAALPRATGEF